MKTDTSTLVPPIYHYTCPQNALETYPWPCCQSHDFKIVGKIKKKLPIY